jgi:hypothetical protein
MDVDLVKSLGSIEKSSYFNCFNKIDSENYEFIPFNVPRFKFINKIISHVEFIQNIDDSGISIKHYGGKLIKYDYVFFGIGFGSKNDPLIKSSLVKRSNFISDHLIFNSNNFEKNTVIKKNINFQGHFRNYKIEKFGNNSIKKSFRPALSKVISDPKNKAIYSTGKIEIFKNIIKSGIFPQLISSLSLRYGTPGFTNHGFNFFQIKMNNIYTYNDKSEIVLNKDIFYSDELTRILSFYNSNREAVLSGIHLHDGYSNIDNNKLISWNLQNFTDARLIILTPNTNCEIDSRHFTSYFMRLSEIAANKIFL